MANKLDPMDLKQIITLHLDGLSNRKIGSLLGISRNTINIYMQLFKASEWSYEELYKLDNIWFPIRTSIDNSRFDTLMQYFEKVNQARNHPGFTFQYHYQEYMQQSSNPTVNPTNRNHSTIPSFHNLITYIHDNLSKGVFRFFALRSK